MAEVVYALCAVTSACCALLLLRGYGRSKAKLLLWSCLCFVGLTANNVLLFVDLVVVPSVDLSMWRSAVALVAMICFVFSLVWDSSA
jgi:hypothetical protein